MKSDLSVLEAILDASMKRYDIQKGIVDRTQEQLSAARDHGVTLAVVRRLEANLKRQTEIAAKTQAEILDLQRTVSELMKPASVLLPLSGAASLDTPAKRAKP